MIGVLMPASNQASMPSRTCDAGPKRVVSASQRSERHSGMRSNALAAMAVSTASISST